MVFLPLVTAWMTPEVPWAPSPVWNGNVSAAFSVPASGALAEVVGEVLRGARVVRAVHGGDGGDGQRRVGVQRGDGRVVPGRDLAVEDVGDGRGVEVQVVDALDVEDDGDRGDVDREVDGLGAGGAAGEGARELVVVQGGVGAGEVGGTRDEALAAGARALGVVVDR